MMKNRVKVKLTLEDGTIYNGFSFGSPVPAAGEVVFNTAMTGYPEILRTHHTVDRFFVSLILL